MQKKYFLIISLFTFSELICFSQTLRVPEENENAAQRQEWFARRKQYPEVNNTELARWNVYRKMQPSWIGSAKSFTANWECLGPENQGGRMIAHAFDPFDSEVFWVGAASGGLWKTSDGGDTWNAMTDQIPNMAIGAVAIKPQDPNIMLIGTGEGYILSPWFQYGIGVLRSTDGGATWNPTNLSVDDSLAFACLGFAWDPINTNNVYLSTTFGIYVSTDAGVNWTNTLSGVGTSLVINKKFPSNVYASLQDYMGSTGGIYHSTDYGVNWQLLTNGTPASADIGFTCLSICDSFPNVLYAGISTPESHPTCGTMQGFYRTSDGGSSWQNINTGIDFYCYTPPFDSICQGWYGNVIQVTPDDSNEIFAGGIFLYRSTNGGTVWDFYDWAPLENPPWMHPDHHSFAISPHNSQLMYSLNDAGVFKSTNGGNTWTKKPNGLVTTQFYSISSSPVDPNLMIGGTQDNGVFYNTAINTTTNWVESFSGDGFTCIMDPLDPAVWYTSELFQGRLKTTDLGATYDTIENGINEPTAFLIPMIMDPTNNQVLFTSTDSKVYKTTNGGLLWTSMVNLPYMTVMAIDKINTNIIYTCTDPALSSSYMYRSTNGGTSWTAILSEPGNKIIDIETDPMVASTLYICRGTYTPGQQIFKSIDLGDSWINITGDRPGIPVNAIAIDPFTTDHIYVATDLGVYLTTDGGSSWNAFNDNLPLVNVQDMHYHTGDSTLRIGTHGRGIWKTKTAYSIAIGIDQQEIADFHFNVFPNPAISDVNISYHLTKTSSVQMKIYNSLGQEVIELINEKQTEGDHNFKWDRRNSAKQILPGGIYYVRMIVGGIAYGVKLLI